MSDDAYQVTAVDVHKFHDEMGGAFPMRCCMYALEAADGDYDEAKSFLLEWQDLRLSNLSGVCAVMSRLTILERRVEALEGAPKHAYRNDMIG